MKKIFSVIDGTKVIQDGYFLNGHSNLVKKSFITELNKFFSISGEVQKIGLIFNK